MFLTPDSPLARGLGLRFNGQCDAKWQNAKDDFRTPEIYCDKVPLSVTVYVLYRTWTALETVSDELLGINDFVIM